MTQETNAISSVNNCLTVKYYANYLNYITLHMHCYGTVFVSFLVYCIIISHLWQFFSEFMNKTVRENTGNNKENKECKYKFLLFLSLLWARCLTYWSQSVDKEVRQLWVLQSRASCLLPRSCGWQSKKHWVPRWAREKRPHLHLCFFTLLSDFLCLPTDSTKWMMWSVTCLTNSKLQSHWNSIILTNLFMLCNLLQNLISSHVCYLS